MCKSGKPGKMLALTSPKNIEKTLDLCVKSEIVSKSMKIPHTILMEKPV